MYSETYIWDLIKAYSSDKSYFVDNTLRRALAEAHGFFDIETDYNDRDNWRLLGKWRNSPTLIQEIPNYAFNSDACNQIERKLDFDTLFIYCNKLRKVTRADEFGESYAYCAKASERAFALYLALFDPQYQF